MVRMSLKAQRASFYLVQVQDKTIEKHFSANVSVSLQYKFLVAVTLPRKPING